MTEPGPPSRRILVIENNTDGTEALCTLLGLWGHRVSSATTGARGIEIALVDAPEVIILDLGLSDMDGCEVIRRIRAERQSEPPWIIAYSGYNERQAQARDAGCDAFVLKPRLDELESSINGAGERARPRKDPGSAIPPRRRSNVA